MGEGGAQRAACLGLVGRRQQRHVRDAAHEGDVVGAGMGGAVGPDQPGAVERKHHGQVLQRHVVDQLVVGPLQEGGVDRHHRPQSFAGQAGGEGDGMLLGDADVVIALGETLVELDHARALAHGRRDRHQLGVGGGHVAQPLPEHLGEGGLGRRGRLDQADLRVELAGAVIGDRVGLGQLVAVALLGDDVQELRAGLVAQVLERGDQRVEVMAVDRADVVEAELLEDRARHDHALGVFLEAARQLEQRRRRLEHALGALARGGIETPAQQPGQVLVERAHRRADRHVVVVEDHQQVGHATGVRHAAVVERLEGHAGGHRAVADDGHRVALLALLLGGQCHAERGRDRGAGVRRAEGVVLALVAARKAAQAAELAQRAHAVAPAGEDLVRIGLVAHVPHQPVFGRVEDMVQRDGQLDRAEVGRQVAAGARDALQHELAQFVSQLLEFGAGQPAHVGRRLDAGEQRLGVHRGFRGAAGRGRYQESRSTTRSARVASQRASANAPRSSAAWAWACKDWARSRAPSSPSSET